MSGERRAVKEGNRWMGEVKRREKQLKREQSVQNKSGDRCEPFTEPLCLCFMYWLLSKLIICADAKHIFGISCLRFMSFFKSKKWPLPISNWHFIHTPLTLALRARPDQIFIIFWLVGIQERSHLYMSLSPGWSNSAPAKLCGKERQQVPPCYGTYK